MRINTLLGKLLSLSIGLSIKIEIKEYYMLCFDERVKHISLKITRAEKHLQELEKELALFFEKKPFQVSVKIDEKARKPIYYLSSVANVPDNIALLTGDIIQNLVTALDHLAYQLISKDTDDNPPKPNAIYFPIAASLEKYEECKLRKLKGANVKTISAIDQIKPYKGGNDLICSLHSLNNIEKHRVLLTAGIKSAGVELFPTMQDSMIKQGIPTEAMNQFRSMGIVLIEKVKGFPLTVGSELYIGAVDEKPKEDMQFHFDVGLCEDCIVDTISLLTLLRDYIKEVKKITSELILLLK